MNQQFNSRSFLTLRNIIFDIVIIAATALVVGSGVYWWQERKFIEEVEDFFVGIEKQRAVQKTIEHIRKESRKETDYLRDSINNLRSNHENIMKQLEEFKPKLDTPRINNERLRSLEYDIRFIENGLFTLERDFFLEVRAKGLKEIIASRANEIMLAIKNRNMMKLSTFIHPDRGVRFTPDRYIEPTHRVFTAAKIRYIFADKTKYIWGETEAGTIELAFKEYYNEFIYDLDFVNAKEITFNTLSGCGPFGTSDIFSFYPQAITVEYFIDENYCRGLVLVFEEKDDIWYLVGIIHTDRAI